MKQCETEMLLSLYESIMQSGGNPKPMLAEGVTVKELIDRIMVEAEEIIRDLPSKFIK